jgi:sortase A
VRHLWGLLRVLGTLLVAAGVLMLAWVVIVWRWQDPFTAIYTHFEQRSLANAYARRVEAYRPRTHGGSLVAIERTVATEAAAYRRALREGQAVGRLKIPRIGLNMIVVQGTGSSTLEKGPGHYSSSAVPGEGHLIYVAGHRTTYLAPFAHIDHIRVGDYVTFAVPYGTFTYRVVRHYVVASNDLAVLRDHAREILRLQACHPRFFATHRYIAYARLIRVEPRGGMPYDLAAAAQPSDK